MSYLEVGKESEPYDLFVFAINAEQTRKIYYKNEKVPRNYWNKSRNNLTIQGKMQDVYRQSKI